MLFFVFLFSSQCHPSLVPLTWPSSFKRSLIPLISSRHPTDFKKEPLLFSLPCSLLLCTAPILILALINTPLPPFPCRAEEGGETKRKREKRFSLSSPPFPHLLGQNRGGFLKRRRRETARSRERNKIVAFSYSSRHTRDFHSRFLSRPSVSSFLAMYLRATGALQGNCSVTGRKRIWEVEGGKESESYSWEEEHCSAL